VTPRTRPASICSPVHSLLKANLAAELLDLVAHLLDHADQPEGADVRFADIKDFRRRAGFDKFLEHLAAVVLGVLDLAVELAIGKGAGAALAKLDVRLGVEHLLSPQPPGILRALADGLATLEDDRPEAALRQNQRGKDAGRAKADDDRSRRQRYRCLSDEVIAHVRRPLHPRIVGETGEHGLLVGQRDVDAVAERRRTGFARIATAPENAEFEDVVLGDAEAGSNRRRQGGRRMLQWKADFADAQHAWFPGKAGAEAQACCP
jgi:hypothetical protein